MTIPSRKLASLTLAGLAAALMLGTALPAAAQMAPIVESPRSLDILARYNEASQAEISCVRPLSMAEETRIAGLAAAASHDEFLAGSMLKTVQDSRAWMRMVIASMSCRDPVVVDRLAFFHQQIEPSLR
jgi:hypothetical protein